MSLTIEEDKEKLLDLVRFLEEAQAETEIESSKTTKNSKKKATRRRRNIRSVELGSKMVKVTKSPKIMLSVADKGSVELPKSIAEILSHLSERVAHGSRFQIVELDNELSTQQAADILNVSRPFLVKLLEKGEIEYRKVGKHRRIDAASLLKYKEDNKKARLETLKELAKQAQELDMGY